MVCRDMGNGRRNADAAEKLRIRRVNERSTARARCDGNLAPSAKQVAGLGADAHGAGEKECRPVMYGYARVSSADQNLDRQLDALLDFGVDACNVFADKASGKNFNRPEWKRLNRMLAEGDTLVVKSIDRFGRNYQEILDEWRFITREKKAQVVVLDMPLLDTRNSCNGITGALISDIVLQLLSYVAQVERESIHQRQAEGIAAAKARGVRFGRPEIQKPEIYAEVRTCYLNGGITRGKAAERLGISISTFDKWIRQDKGERKTALDAKNSD